MVGLLMMLLLNFGAMQAQPQQGLMSRLIEIKYSTELYLTTQIKNETNPVKKDSALALYNIMRWKVDGFVYQLSSILITKNSPKVFKKLDAWCYDHKESILNLTSHQNIATHVASFAAIDALYQNQIAPKLYKQPKRLNLTTNVFYLLKDSYSIIKGLSDLKTRKTMAIVELLDHARLLSPGEVGKGGK
jgi:3-methyladenine DNA glycosylase AlkC